MGWEVLSVKHHRHPKPATNAVDPLTTRRNDYMQGTSMKFKSEDDAVHFAEKMGECYFHTAHSPNLAIEDSHH